jgi:hypothetical protein
LKLAESPSMMQAHTLLNGGITAQSREMVVHYGQAVNQKRLAAAAILKWEALEQAALA